MQKCRCLFSKAWLLMSLVLMPPIVAAGCTGGITQISCNTYQEIKLVNSKVDTILSCSSSILGGDVTGPLCNNVVRFVGGESAVDVAAATLAVQAATPFDAPDTLVLRDSFGNFNANMITLDGLVMNPTDAATKAYVDSVASAGLVVKDPALVVSLTNVSLSGTPTIDGVVLVPDDRVLLIGQSNPIENGLWLSEVGTWSRPLDFATGTTAASAYVLILTGSTQVGSSWVCSTPTSIIDTDPLAFVQFALAGQVTGANIGTGTGEIFRNKTGLTLNFKTIADGPHMVVTNGADEVTLSTDATAIDVPNTIVSRDAAGIITVSEVRLEDAAGGEYIGLRSTATMPASYTVELPANVPLAGQVLQAISANATQWATIGGLPTANETYYVSLAGNDSNDGSFGAPFLTVMHAVSVANTVANVFNPVAINVGPGFFIEDNTGGPITITADGITIIGTSMSATTIVPTSTTTNLFDITTTNVQLSKMSLSTISADSDATAISLTIGLSGAALFDAISINQFKTGLVLSGGGGSATVLINSFACLGNGTNIEINNIPTVIQNSVFIGPIIYGLPAVNTGVTVTGSSALVAVFSTAFAGLATGVSVTGGANLRVLGSDFDNTVNSIVCSGGSSSSIDGCNFLVNSASSINVGASGASTNVGVTGCNFNCKDSLGVNAGTALQATTQSNLFADSCSVNNAAVGIQCGTTGDTVTTVIRAIGIGLLECTTDINQVGSSKLHFVGGTFEGSKISIADPTNVSFAAFDSNGEAILAIGNATDNVHSIYRIENGEAIPPNLTYNPNYYGQKGTVYLNPNPGATFNATQAQIDKASYFVVTGDRAKEAALGLISDTGNFGVGDFVRGWEITKKSGQADLAFTYSNNDTSGLAARGANTVMNLNGFDNQVEFPTATNAPLPTNTVAKLIWAGDTDLYRLSANSLKTDGNLTVGGLTPAGVVHNDVTGLLSSSLIVNNDINALAGITDDKLATISTPGKVANSATTATSVNTPNTIVLRDALGDFSAGTISAALTGSASLDVLKAGDTMTGNLNMAAQSEVRFQDAAGGEYVGLQAPATIPGSYTVSLPANIPTAGQVLQATAANATQWATIGGVPTASKTYYVALNGSDSNDGSFSAPFRHVAYAVGIANGFASQFNPITISVGAGLFIENNSGGPIAITASGISIVGSSIIGTIIVPNTLSIDLFSATTPNINFFTLTLDAGAVGSTAAALNLVAGIGQGGFQSIIISRFQTGFSFNGSGGLPLLVVDDSIALGTGTAFAVNNARVIIEASIFLGNTTGVTPANTGVTVTGANALVTMLSNSLRLLATGVSITDGADVRILGSNFENSINSIVASGASETSASGCNFLLNQASSINVAASGAGTIVNLTGCFFDGADTLDVNQGTAILVTTAANIIVDSCSIEQAVVGIQTGTTGDTSTTSLKAVSVGLTECTTDIIQVGSSTLQFVGGTFDEGKLSIADPTNVSFAAFNSDGQAILAIGDGSDTTHAIYQMLNGQATLPNLTYNPNYYGNKGTVYQNPNADPTFNATQAQSNDAAYYVVTGDRAKVAALNLISDTGAIGVGDNVRGWALTKKSDQADLAFTYSNNDTSGLAARGANSVVNFNGFDNQVEFPLATNAPLPTNTVAKLVWAGDTNLYRDAANTLKTDDNLVVATLTPAGVVHNDATGLLTSSLIVNNDISASAGITDNKLATISTPGKVANSATTATAANTPNTIVLRDALGDFSAGTISAAVTGSASLNVLKAGDTMTGNLNMAAQSEVRFQDAAGGEYVGLHAPATIPGSYTVSLPANVPTAGQVLQATAANATQWATIGGLSTANETYYVSLAGNDSNDGSFGAPFRTVAHAVTVANTVASMSNPVAINVGPGFFVENNTGGPITITADGISIVGTTLASTNIVPMSTAIGLFDIATANVELSNLALLTTVTGSTATAVNLTAGFFGNARFNSLVVGQFQTAFAISSGGGVPSVLFDHLECAGNGTNIASNNILTIIKNSVFQGPLAFGLPAANTGISITGATGQVGILSCTFSAFDTAAIAVSGGAEMRVLGSDIDGSVNGIVCSGGGKASVDGCNFLLNLASSVNVSASGAGTVVNVTGCNFNCKDSLGANAGTALQTTSQASLFADSCSVNNAVIGIQCGTTGDTVTTVIRAIGIGLLECTTDIDQNGSSKLHFVGGTFEGSKISIADPTNVSFAAFDSNGEAILAIGNATDNVHSIYRIENGEAIPPNLTYNPNYYGQKGTVYLNPNAGATFNATQAQSDKASYFVVTGDRAKEAALGLISDTGNFGVGDFVRGWAITKKSDQADLAFTYSNNDTSGLAARGANSVVNLNGFDNQLEFPLATNAPLPTNTVAKLVWAGDTNLYRDAANTLKTDDNLVVATLTPAGIVHNDATGLLTTSLIVNNDISASAGITDNKLATISTAGKVANSATTATAANTPNTIVLRDALGDFAAGTITADLIGNASTATTALNTTNFTGLLSGDVTGSQSATVVSFVGGQSAVNVAAATVAANAATPSNTPNTIVKRDAFGTFSASVISANLTGNVTGNLFGNATTATTANSATNFTGTLAGDVSGTQGATVVNTVGGQTAANVAAATVAANAATSSDTAGTIVKRDGTGSFSAGTITANLSGNVTGNLFGNATTATSALTANSATTFTGPLLGDVTGTQGATVVSFVGGQSAANVAASTSTVLSATSNNIPSTLVLRDAAGNFAAGTITADLIGNASTATTAINSTNFTGLLSGDVTGSQSATVVSFVGGQSAANVAAATVAANAATPSNTPNTIVKRDASGNFSVSIISGSMIGNVTGNLFGNATTATTAQSATNFTGSLAGDVSGTQGATVVNTVGGQTAANVAAATVLANGATSSNTASAIVRRDGSGNFSATTITANLSGNVTGDVTGNLFGNAATATSALTANSATTFTGPLLGDVTGTQGATVVSFVGGKTAATVALATDVVNSATSNNTANTLVLRDSLSNFSTNMISIGGTITNPTDVTTKAYVDAAVAGGFTVKDPALATSLTNVSLTGTPTIDGVVTVPNDRVLLVGQTDPIENGLWLTAVGTWTRPLDFASGTTAGTAYVLTTSGLTQAGNGWVCSTPSAIIDTDPLAFAQFSIAGQTTAANVGTGAGQIFRDKTGQTINLKTIAAGTHMVVTNNTNEVTLSTDATSANTPSTIIARDASGNFSAGIMTGSASLNVLKAGDTMTGNLNMATQSEVRFEDAAGGEYIGLHAPAIVPASYTISLPDGAPVAGQVLFASSSATTTWKTVDEPPSVTKTYYVTLAGNDSNDGSLSAPFLTVKHAVNVANTVASLSNPVVISVGAGIFVEDNTGGPITITADSISIVGESVSGTNIVPMSTSINLFDITTASVELARMTLLTTTTDSTATAINLTAGPSGNASFDGLAILQFQTGIAASSAGGLPALLINQLTSGGNAVNVAINNIPSAITNSVFVGSAVFGLPSSNTGITITGTGAITAILSCVFAEFQTGVLVTGGAPIRILGSAFESAINGVVCSGGSQTSIDGCNFIKNIPSTINVSADGANTRVSLTGCSFICTDSLGTPQGTAMQATAQANMAATSCSILSANVGIQCGTTGDTSTTAIRAISVGLAQCIMDINQVGSSSLQFVGGTFDEGKLSIANTTNVSFSAFNIDAQTSLAIGDGSDAAHTLYQVLNGQALLPNVTYNPNYYGYKGTVYQNQNADPTFNATQAQSNDAAYYVVTGDRAKVAALNLISDTSNFGVGDLVRGWALAKTSTQADLAFTYSNNDTSGLAARGANSVVNFNGFDNQVEFPVATNTPLPTNTVAKLVWAGDTNLYRDSANTLKTDDNLVVATLTPAGVVHNDATGLLTSSLIVNNDISASAGITDNKLATISTAGKVANSATTATSANSPNTIVLRDASGNFNAGTISAAVTGSASLNVLKAGDTMTGNLNMAAQSEVRFEDAAGGEYIGLHAPTTVPASYTVSLPSSAPSSGQVLQATSASATQWATAGGSPSASKSYYVSLAGNDSNDGSFLAPFLTIKQAVNVANTVASLANPVAIYVGAGIFIEDNSGGALTITAPGISIVGSSISTTIISPTTSSTDLFSITTSDVEMTDMTLSGTTGSTAAAVNQVTTAYGRTYYRNMVVGIFQTGFSINASGTSPAIFVNNITTAGNGTSFAINDAQVIIEDTVLRGPLGGGPANTGITITGTNAEVQILSSVFSLFTTAVSVDGGASLSLSGSAIEKTINGIVCAGASSSKLTGLTFTLNSASSINVAASQAGTGVYVIGCLFDCEDASDNPQGTAIQAMTGASIIVDSSTIEMAVVGIQTGTTGDTSSTMIRAISVGLIECTTDISQVGSSMLQFVGGTFDEFKLNIADSTNVSFSAFNSDGQSILAIGDGSDTTYPLYQVLNGQAGLPNMTYNPNYYGHKGTVYQNPNSDPTFNATQAQTENAAYYVVTGDRTKKTEVNLISDTSNFGVGDSVRGWSMTKEGDQADLAFTYSNNDTSGLAARGANKVMNVNGFDNQVEFPAATNAPLPTNTVAKLVWASDTNLYRDAANTLKTDDNLVVATLTPAGVVHNDATGLLTSSLIVNNDISASAGITDNKLATISTAGKVANSATTATSANTPNTIVLRDASGNFAAGTITADLIGNASTATTAITTINFTGLLSGDVTGTQSATVVSFVGGQSAANIVSGVVAANAATPTNTPSTIVKRDASGNFNAGIITASLIGNVTGNLFGQATTATTANSATNFTGSLSGDVTGNQSSTVVSTVGGQTAANVAAGAVLANAATSANTPSAIVRRDASGNFSAGIITASLIGNVTGDLFGQATTATSALNFSGSLSGDVTGTQGATVVSTVGGQTAANVAAATVLANAATSVNTPSAIVRRDASGNFSAGIITASLIGDVTGNLFGNATTATTANSAINFTGALSGDVTGTQSATVVSTVGGQTAANVASGAVAANAATPTNTPSTIVKRDASGNFIAGTITANLTGNVTGNLFGNATTATTAISATNFTGSLSGDVTGNQSSTVVSTVGGQSAANVAAATVLANAATSANTASAIVRRDASGNFSAGIITASLIGNVTGNLFGQATTATSALNFSGSLSGDVTGTQGATVVSTVGGQTAANVAAGVVLANAATSANTPSTIVRRDASGNFSAGIITASLIGDVTGNLFGNATTATTANSAINFTGALSGDVTGTQNATVVSTVGGQTAANVASGAVAANAATPTNTPSTIVKRDASGNFIAGTITANLTGNVTGNLFGNATTATTANSATNFTGSLSGDVTGNQSSTVVSTVGGQSAANVAAATVLANAATSANTASAIVRRDASGDFSAGTITASLIGAASLNVLKTGDTMTGILTLPATDGFARPQLAFSGSNNTGIAAPVADELSFYANGNVYMTVAPSLVTIANGARTTFDGVSCDQAVQVANPASASTVTCLAGTSVLLLRLTGNRTNVTVAFPSNPVDGQYFTIIDASTFTITLINTGGTGGASIVNGITGLAPANNFTASANGAMVRYYYYAATNTWYRAGRG